MERVTVGAVEWGPCVDADVTGGVEPIDEQGVSIVPSVPSQTTYSRGRKLLCERTCLGSYVRDRTPELPLRGHSLSRGPSCTRTAL